MKNEEKRFFSFFISSAFLFVTEFCGQIKIRITRTLAQTMQRQSKTRKERWCLLVDALSDIIVIISKEMTGHHDRIIIILVVVFQELNKLFLT